MCLASSVRHSGNRRLLISHFILFSHQCCAVFSPRYRTPSIRITLSHSLSLFLSLSLALSFIARCIGSSHWRLFYFIIRNLLFTLAPALAEKNVSPAMSIYLVITFMTAITTTTTFIILYGSLSQSSLPSFLDTGHP